MYALQSFHTEKKEHLKEIKAQLLPIYAHNSIQQVRLKAPDFFLYNKKSFTERNITITCLLA